MKHKKLFAILLSLAIMVTFMPTMAFAAQGSSAAVKSWGAKYATVTDVNGKTFNTARTFDSASALVKAEPQDDTSVAGGTVYAPETDAYFVDLEGSYFAYYDGSEYKKLDGAKMTRDYLYNLIRENRLVIQVVEPSYTEAFKTTGHKADTTPCTIEFTNGPESTFVGTAKIANDFYTVSIDVSKYDFEKPTQDQDVTFSVNKISAKREVYSTYEDPDIDGTVESAKFTVKGEEMTPEYADFYFDSTDGTAFTSGVNYTNYDGSAHTVVATDVPGWTLSYATYNNTTGKWVDTAAVSLTDVEESNVRVKATFKKTGEADKFREFYVNLRPAHAFVGFDMEESLEDYSAYYEVPGTEYNTADYITVVADKVPVAGGDNAKAAAKAMNVAWKKAAEANKTEILALFNELKDVNAKIKKSDADLVYLTFADKDLTSKETKAVYEKYAQLMRNFHLSSIDGALNADVAPVEATIGLNKAPVVQNVQFDDITFSGVTTKAFKAKKKTKKLAKTKSFQIAAVADSGNAITFSATTPDSKIVVSADGKVTVKKGLKKGTYKFTVKAKTAAGNGYRKASATNEYTIKIK
jgi:hypothetical protein